MDRQITLDIRNAIGELVAIEWKNRNEVWTEFFKLKIKINVLCPLRRVIRWVRRDGVEVIFAIKYERLLTFCYSCDLIGHTTGKCTNKEETSDSSSLNLQSGSWLKANTVAQNQDRSMWRNRIEIVATNGFLNKAKDESKTDTKDESEQISQKGKRKMGETESYGGKPIQNSEVKLIGQHFTMQGGSWRSAPPRAMKILCWNCRGVGNPMTVHELKQLLVANDPDIVFLCETRVQSNKMSRIRCLCRMDGCLAVNAIGKSGGLAMLWREGTRAEITNYLGTILTP
ncbi:hypothetical protein Golob_012028 [Gossypium lobatum]|uniref:Zinc knuckle CX2CX4HX4C domain-containing protein n=1 Tax=Gossypium lobatum TaxID=34289 RepID=A0A7J8MRT6_9ROSI|nr:hypothetical protein [Gossypium lobatum]